MLTTLSTGGMLDQRWVVNADALASATASTVVGGAAHGCRALDLRVARGIDVRILPDRGFDIGAAWYDGVPLAWISVVGEVRPLDMPREAQWVDRFGGGLVTTCGLRNVGVPSEGHGQHGQISHLPASDVVVERIRDGDDLVLTASAQVAEGGALGPDLRLQRTITTRTGSGLVTITDVTTNAGATDEPTPLLYHVNVGAPLWGPGGRLELDVAETIPRDDDARAGIDVWAQPPIPAPDAPEQVFEHVVRPGEDGWATATVANAGLDLALDLRWEHAALPRLHQWRHPGQSVIGIEPANCSVLGRAADRAEGRLPLLAAGESRTTRVEIHVRRVGDA